MLPAETADTMSAVSGPSLPAPIFERHGLGWIFRPPDAPVSLVFDRVVERRDEVSAEIHLMLRNGEHLARRRVNLLGSRVLTDLARDMDDLTGGADWPWRRMIAEGCETALESFRRGTPLVVVEGAMQPAKPIEWLCHELVMSNVVNVWVAAAGTGKSTLLKALCLSHALGKQFLGRATGKGVPLYLDYEDSEENFRRALSQVASGMGEQSLPRTLWKRGGGPLRNQVHQLAEIIDHNHVTLLCIDAVAAAGGEMDERGYESLALGLEQALVALPPVTIILIDHITSDEMKNGGVPIKARGSARKYEFARYQWTIVADHDAAADGRHVVGWTHVKSNLTRIYPPFGVNIIHEDDRIVFGPADAIEVQQLADRMTVLQKIIQAIKDARGPRTVDDLAQAVYDEATKGKRESIRKTLDRDKGRHVQLLQDGSWTLKEPHFAGNVTPIRSYQDDEDLPW